MCPEKEGETAIAEGRIFKSWTSRVVAADGGTVVPGLARRECGKGGQQSLYREKDSITKAFESLPFYRIQIISSVMARLPPGTLYASFGVAL